MQKWLGVGNLVKDPNHTQKDGKDLAFFTIAVNEYHNRKKSTTYFNCVVKGAASDNIIKFFSKGKPIFVSGRVYATLWKGNGDPKPQLNIEVEQFDFVNGTGDKAPQRQPVQQRQPASQAPQYDGPDENFFGADDSDIPF